MALYLGQLVYTSFPGVGFTCLKSAAIPIDMEEAFIEEIVYRYWDAYDPPPPGYRAVYLHQVTFCDLLFGWFYNDGMDEFGRYDVPYFICYYWSQKLDATQLKQILACLQTGPLTITDRQTFTHRLDSILFQESSNYQAARLGVEISEKIIQQSHQALEQKNLLNLLVEGKQSEVTEQSKPSSYSSNLVKNYQNFSPIGEGNFNLHKLKFSGNLNLTAIIISLAVTTLPIAGLGTVTYHLASQSLGQYLSQLSTDKKFDAQDLAAIRRDFHNQLRFWLMGTGGTAILVGAITSWLVSRTMNKISKAAEISAQIIQEIEPDKNKNTHELNTRNELVTLETNLKIIATQINQLLKQTANYNQIFSTEHKSDEDTPVNLTKEKILNQAVAQARQEILTERVLVYCFDINWGGKVIAESVAPGISSTLDVAIAAPGFAQSDRDRYRNGCGEAIANIYEAGLNLYQIELLEKFSIKANLVAPILIDNQLFGLLIAHQCSQTRQWQNAEINWFTQLAKQIGWDLQQGGFSGCLF